MIFAAISDSTIPQGGLTPLDHLVIGIYLVSMLAMGVSIARKQKSADDFFVGGRNLPAWAVGISIFASLLSTITFLGMPGEMFRTGIGFLTRQLGIPLVLLVVWFLWIPFFMKLNLTSAYEYLEKRFSYLTRSLAAIFCLLLLFGWISVVVLTASMAMSEITKLDIQWFFGRNYSATQTHPDGSARINPEDLNSSWGKMVSGIRNQGLAERPTPGKRIWELLDESARIRWERLSTIPVPNEEQKQIFCRNFSQILTKRNLFNDQYWNTEAEERIVQTYLKVGLDQLSNREVTHLNRTLIELAFPNEIIPSHPAYRNADMHVLIVSIGLFSVLYSTLGGIRAVIWTDVIQFFVLMTGAFFTMGTVAWLTSSGIGDWLETSQNYKHEAVEWIKFDIGDRSNVAFISIGMSFWFICTHGSNQVALQRYFTVKDVRAARNSYLVSALVSLVIGVILAGVGISLMHFIQNHDLPAKYEIHSAIDGIRNASQDAVFPQFISRYLPSGLRGMVVAALFAAAMSTIDSGANSASTIVTVDFIRRLKRTKTTDEAELKRARILTAGMGLIVVLYTMLLYHLSKGTDIISLCQKGFNCFLGPLGAIFVLGMFSKKTTSASVVPAFLIGEVVGVSSSYSKELFNFDFSTHLVIASSWLVTIIAAHLFAFLMRTEATPQQQQLMWRPVVKGETVRSSTTNG
jgi:SSS family transporter